MESRRPRRKPRGWSRERRGGGAASPAELAGTGWGGGGTGREARVSGREGQGSSHGELGNRRP